jgi:hypothetical protein
VDNFSVRWTGRFTFEEDDYTFLARADDGIRVWADGDLLINAWRDQSPTVYRATHSLTAGEHEVRVEYYEHGGGAVAQLDWDETACPLGQYRAEYYNNRTLSGSPAFTRCENPPINYDWGTGSPGNGMGADNFSVRWTGRFRFSGGNYSFISTTDDGLRLWVDGAPIIDQWRDQGATEYRACRSLTAGEHEVKVEYYEHGGESVAKLRWESGCGTGSPISYRVDGGVHIVRINLRDPRVHFRNAIANNDQGGRETVVSMAHRLGAKVAINGDYFDFSRSSDNYWSWPWPQGMTWINGVDRTQRCENHPTNCSYWRADWWRSSLAISHENQVDIARMEQRRDSPNNYNVIGGGPRFIKDGNPEWVALDRVYDCTINDEPFPRANCPSYTTQRSNWTAVGLTQDGNTMIIVAGSNMLPGDMIARMQAEGAYDAIRMDGGGSSTLYYDGALRFWGEGTAGRAVADALMVFVD